MRVPFALSPMPKVVCLLVYPISSTLMPEVVESGSRSFFLPAELGLLA